MKIGLVGFPGSGKTSVFHALTGLQTDRAHAARPGTISLGTVKVPDERLDRLAALYSPRKTTYAEITFSDIAGGGGQRALDRSVLTAMREVDALAQVLRSFDNPAVGEPAAPRRELEDLHSETLLADLDIVERRVERLRKEHGDQAELALLDRLQEDLGSGRPLRLVDLDDQERGRLSGYQLLSLKPLLIVLNVEEEAVAEPVPRELEEAAAAVGAPIVTLSAAVEMDIAQMSPAEQEEFSDALGLSEPARARFIRAAFGLLDLVTMFTVGPDECRAWPVRRGTGAPRAAGKVHSDMERGFIRAEVIDYRDLLELGAEARVREAGKLRIEGRSYEVRDGDVVHVRFNV